MLASYGSSRVQSQPAQARLTGFNATCSTRKIRVAVAASKKLQIQSPKQQFKKLLVHATAQSETPVANQQQSGDVGLSQIGLIGLAVMGQNLSLNIASKGFSISVYNRSYSKTEAAVQRAAKEGLATKLRGFEDIKDFVQSLERPRRVILLVKAGAPVDATIEQLLSVMEEGDIIIDGGNEWYENTERRAAMVEDKGLLYMGMGVSGGEEGARNGPSLMPGGSPEAYKFIQPIVEKVAAQVDDGPCVTYVGPGGAGNFVKMVHNGIEYGDMQLISEAYDILKTIGGLTNQELSAVFDEWNQGQVLRGQQAAIAGGSNACDIEDRMSACMNPNQINGGQEEVEQQQQPQAFHYYPPFPPMVGTLQYPFILQQMFNPQNLDVVLGVPVPPWIINPTPSSPSDTAEQPAPHNQAQQNADVDLTPSQNNVQNEPGENLGGCGNTGDENP
eukprot:TRINITY_DN1568_c0_g1_i12.p1 TRINITY_DN1568_c0_g1~~TRINITY_DN1568_c0_g1_i12.p1  ORF type:complete len:445 (-),score=111.41 TRINITY_DN1568_c0_g1_i12:5032-6366(-)